MQRLLKRRKLQECLEETEKEIGEGSMSLNELESLLNEEGIDTKIESLPSRRIASNNNTRFLLISNVKEALAEAKKKEENKSLAPPSEFSSEKVNDNTNESTVKNDELEDDLQKAIKMSLECVDDQDASANTSKTDESWTSNFTESDYSDSEDEDGFIQSDLSSAKAYIMQYTDLTDKAIDEIVTSKQKGKKKRTGLNVDKIIEELNNEKSIIEERIDLTSSEDDSEKHIAIPKKNVTEDLKTDTQIKNDQSKDTEASVICVEEDKFEVITLDTSTEDLLEDKSIFNVNNNKALSELSAIKQKSYDINKASERNPCDTSEKSGIVNHEKEMISENLSESSEDEFEEVSDDGKFKVPVVQLTLNVNEKMEDDIFADIFNKNSAGKSDQENAVDNNMPSNVEIPKINEDSAAKNVLEKNIILSPLETSRTSDEIEAFKDAQIALGKKIESSNDFKNISNSTTLDCKGRKENLVCETFKPANQNKSASESIPVTVPDRNSFEASADKSAKESKVASVKEASSGIFQDELNSIAIDIQEQEDNLVQEKSRLDRVGRNITEQITKEAQELLQIFGIPYIIAPMEAEAQCAFLESVKLTDGTITDDSDIWLFGGQTVYKNFFNQKKHVLQYLSERIEKSFNLTREQLILLALLVGSDYTTGISGVGPVTALEILASFPFNKKKMLNEHTKQAQYQEMITGLIDFKKWVRAGRRTDNISLKKKLKNVKLTDDFPSVRVVQAYLEPNVEKSEENFTWGNIDVTVLRDYTKAKFGWSQNKLDEIIKPVLKRIQDRKNQKLVQDYFKRKTDFQSLEDQMSKRVKAAVQRIAPHTSSPNIEQTTNKKNVQPTKIRKRKLPASKTTCDSAENTNIDDIVPSTSSKRPKDVDNINTITEVVKTEELHEKSAKFSINITKSQRVQEIIPQREKDKQSMLQNKLKAIEMFRKTKIDRKTKTSKRKLPKPKEDAELSESSDSN
ncbi:DNA excision repair protein ERCC-5 homolog isoform X2 [Aricia agestis]|nr:DNA excision repair protein ERCC-5 homolog isoform X2 [Aricia agestis]